MIEINQQRNNSEEIFAIDTVSLQLRPPTPTPTPRKESSTINALDYPCGDEFPPTGARTCRKSTLNRLKPSNLCNWPFTTNSNTFVKGKRKVQLISFLPFFPII